MKSTPREKLIELLEQEGFSEILLYPAQGVYRSNRHYDCYRWTGYGKKQGLGKLTVTLQSWDTMTDCARQGITISNEHSSVAGGKLLWSFDVWAKGKAT
jgi:hypothetical protein